MDLERVSESPLPTRYGLFVCTVFWSRQDGHEHLALVHGTVAPSDTPLVRVHSECLTGDVFGSLRCDCGTQLHGAMGAIIESGAGIVVYLRGHEGRGIGLGQKILAYRLQDRGLDTVDANLHLGHAVDSRDYSAAAAMLLQLGVNKIRLITNNPQKIESLNRSAVSVVEQVRLATVVTPENERYLRTKRDRLGHLVAGLE